MVSVFMMSPYEMGEHIAKQAQSKRLSLNLSQQTLSERSGVSYGVIKKFERSGKISLESLLKIAIILDCLEDFKDLFAPTKPEQYASLDELINDKARKRGRK
jgi:transcriptional regulator with XRE-family HTH domain